MEHNLFAREATWKSVNWGLANPNENAKTIFRVIQGVWRLVNISKSFSFLMSEDIIPNRHEFIF